MENYIMRTYWDYKMVEQVLEDMEFELLVSENEDGDLVLKVRDMQGANLGDIESEEFTDFDSLMGRFSGAYFDDYYLEPILFEFDKEIDEWEDCRDLVKQIMNLPYERIKNCLWTINVLGLFGEVYE